MSVNTTSPTMAGNLSRVLQMSKYCHFPPPSSNLSLQSLRVPATTGLSPALTVWMYLIGIFSVSGVAANLLVLTIVLTFAGLRKGVGVFIPHLLTCHLVICGIICPVFLEEAVAVAIRRRPVDCAGCRYREPFMLTFAFIVNWNDALLAINRFVAVLFPLQFHRVNNRIVQFTALAVVWLFCFMTTVPPIFGFLASYGMVTGGACNILPTTKVVGILIALNIYCPLIVVAAAAVCIAAKFAVGRQGSAVMPGHGHGRPVAAGHVPSQSMSERQKRMSRMLLASFACSLACQLPQFIALVAGKGSRDPTVTLFLSWWALLQYGFTPIVYLIMNKDYQSKAGILYAKIRGRSTDHSNIRTPAASHVMKDQLAGRHRYSDSVH